MKQNTSPFKYVSAVTLAYEVAPYPMDNDAAFLSVLHSSQESLHTATLSGGWLSRAWRHVSQIALDGSAGARQAAFERSFAHQLEAYADEPRVVLVSARCALLSLGQPHWGTMYLTNGGLYFSTSGSSGDDDLHSCSRPEEHRVDPSLTFSTEELVDGNVSETRHHACTRVEHIKEYVRFSDIASMLPSIVLNQRGETPQLYIQGVPSIIVAPTALQIFTAKPRCILHLIHISSVVMRPPEPKPCDANSTLASNAPTKSTEIKKCASVHHVLSHSEYRVARTLPKELDGLKLTSLAWRLWKDHLKRLGLPLQRPDVQYADPH